MSIKMKLLLSYLGMIIIPVVLIIFTVYLFDTLISFYNSRDSHGEISIGVRFRSDINKQFRQSIFEMIRNHPQRFTDPEYLREFETEHNLASRSMGIITVRNKQITYISPHLPITQLQNYFYQKNDFNEWFTIHNKTFSIEKFNLLSQNNGLYRIYLLTDATSFYHLGKTFLITIPMALIFFIILTNGLLTFFMSRRIIQPLEALQRATEEIKTGNLNFQIPIHFHDELGKLAKAFEEMRRRLKESLEIQTQYENNRKELIAGISHDLKTPVTSIKGYVDGILDGVADSPEKLRRYLKTIQTKAANLDRLIDELFLFSKLDLGKQPFQFVKVNLPDLAQDFYEELRFELDEKNIELCFENHSQKPLWVWADREKLARVMRNLVDNSLKYMPNQVNPRIVLGIKASPGEATVWVGDNGPGISAPDLPFIFDNFFRANRARNSATDGSGLGLAIAKRIIQEHKGQIRVEQGLHQGTIISFSLPVISDKTVVSL